MKQFKIILLGFVLILGATNNVFSGCGNCAPGGPTGGPEPKEPCGGAGDPVNPYTGNEYRTIPDLKIWGGVGTHQMEWARLTNSRAVTGGQLFGMGHYWRHSYQYELTKIASDGQGRARVNVIYPAGETFEFTKVDAQNWVPTESCAYTMVSQGNDLLMSDQSQNQYLFKRFTSGSSTYYLMTSISDIHGSAYTLSYDSNRKLVSITEPAGRSLNVTYQTLLANKVDFSNLATLTSVPPADTWVELPIKSTTAYRYVRLKTADAAYGNIAEVEFYDDLGNKLDGTVICSESLAQANKAFDGDPSTAFVSTAFSGSYIGLDLGTSQKLSKVRFLSAAGKAALMVPTKWGYTAAKVDAANEVPVSVSVISKVSTSDGREVNYTYSPYTDSTVPYLFQTLTGAVYGDGTKASYTYGQTFPSQRPLVSVWNDVRYGMPQNRSKTIYQDNQASSFLGFVDSQVNPDTGAVILKISDQGLHNPTVTFSNGAKITRKMDDGRIGTAIDAYGKSTKYLYDSNGFMSSMTDSLGRKTTYVRTALSNVNQITHPDGSVESWTRDAKDRILTHTDTLGRTTTNTLDSQGRITRIDYPDSSYETFTYNDFSQVTEKRSKNGSIERFSYDLRGLMTQRTDALGNVTKYGYDSADRLASVTDARNNVTTIAYNERGLVTKVTNADASFKTFEYDSFGNNTSVTNELGNVTTMTYDIFKRKLTSTDPMGRTTKFFYGIGPAGGAGGCSSCHIENYITEINLPSGKKVNYEYDLKWKKTKEILATGTNEEAVTKWSYDSEGQMILTVDPRGKSTMISYDSRGRKSAQVDPLGNRTQWTYDFEGNNLTVTDALNRVTSSAYDSMNRLTSTTDAQNQTTSFYYDLAGNMIKMVDAKGNAYQNTFDLLNRKTAMIYPDNSQESYAFDAVSNLVTYTTRAGQIRTCSYDNRNREISCDWSDSTPDVTRTFDALGRLLTSTNSVSAITYTYNVANEMLTEKTVVGTQSRTLTYSYNIDGNRASVTYPGGNVITYDYTKRNQISAIYDDGIPPLATYSYDLNGNRIAKTLENGTATTYTFDNASRLTAISDKKGSTTLLSTAYTLNAVGNRTAKTQSGTTEKYTFDAIDQVTGVSYTGGTASTRSVNYNYDSVGNRTSVVDNGVSTSYQTNNLNAYTSVGGSAVGNDSNGNLLSYSANGLSSLYFYDAQNRLTKATVGANTTEFAYDSKNRVVKRTLNGVPTFLIYDGWSLVEERDGSGNVLARYVHGTNIDEILTKVDSTGAVYYHHDGLGSTTMLTDSTGFTVEKYSYDVFGKATIFRATSQQLIATSSYGNRFLFTGREFLKEVNLYDYRNRVYSQELGRFLQTDPIRFSAGDVNMYRYVGNDVVDLIDPSGLCPCTDKQIESDTKGYNDCMIIADEWATAAEAMWDQVYDERMEKIDEKDKEWAERCNSRGKGEYGRSGEYLCNGLRDATIGMMKAQTYITYMAGLLVIREMHNIRTTDCALKYPCAD